MMIRLLLLPLLLLPLSGHATSAGEWFGRQAEGWFWYEDPPKDEVKQQEKVPPAANATTTMPTQVAPPPKEVLRAFQERLENAQAQAIMQPSHEHVAAYLYLQKQAMDNSERFANIWQQVVWMTPELDHTQVRPTSPLAIQAYYDARNENTKQSLQQFAETHGLFYFFRSSCPYCQRFAPVLKSFAQRHGFHVTAISMDGGTTLEFPDSRGDNGTARRLGIQTVPAVYLVEPKTRSVQPVSFGLIGPAELEERLMMLMSGTGDAL